MKKLIFKNKLISFQVIIIFLLTCFSTFFYLNSFSPKGIMVFYVLFFIGMKILERYLDKLREKDDLQKRIEILEQIQIYLILCQFLCLFLYFILEFII